MNKEVDPEVFLQPRARPASLREQLAEMSFWFCTIALWLLVVAQALISVSGVSERPLTDFGSLYASASLANMHVNPYRDHPLVNHLREIDRHGPYTALQGWTVNAINLNPPILLYPFRLLARLDPNFGFETWTYISLVLFIASIGIVLYTYPSRRLRIRLLWILSLAGVWYTFELGQVYMILLLAAALGWMFLRKQEWVAAGIFIGILCAIKPNFLVWPGLLILGRSKKTGFTAVATAGVLSAIPLLLQGPGIYREWLAACRGYNGYELPGNASLLAIFSRAGISGVGFALTLLMLAGVSVWVLLRKPETLYTSELAILASLFAGPISWIGYTIVLIPVMYGKAMDTATRIGCILLCVPLWVLPIKFNDSRAVYVLFWAPNIYGLMLIAASAIRKGRYEESSAAAVPEPTFISGVSCSA
jgi:hypothetical protein